MNELDLKCFEKMLPSDWDRMTLFQRVEFTRGVHHKGFRSYLFFKDKDVENYILRAYVIVFSFPADKYSAEAKGLLKRFAETLNLQYVECTNPPMVEIRKVGDGT